MIDERDAIAQRLDLTHMVRGQNRRAPGSTPFDEQILDGADVDRVETGGGLVEHADIRIAQQHRRNLYFLRHTFAQAIDPPRCHVGEVDALQPGHRSAARFVPAQSLQGAEIRHHIENGQLGVEPALFRQVAETIQMLAAARLAEHPDFSPVGANDVHQDADERALAGAVRPQQPEDLPAEYVE